MCRVTRFFLSAACVLAVMAGTATAAPTEWYDDWTTPTPPITQGLSSITIKPDRFPNPPVPPFNFGSSGVTAAQLVVLSSQNNGTPDHFEGRQFTLNVKVTDVDSGNLDNFSFTFAFGNNSAFGGSTLSKNKSHLEDLVYVSGDLGVGKTISGNIFTPIKWSYAWPGAPRDGTNGRISFTFDVRPADITKGGSAPEPSTMLLSCVGLSLLSARAWRRRRQELVA